MTVALRDSQLRNKGRPNILEILAMRTLAVTTMNIDEEEELVVSCRWMRKGTWI